MSTITTLMVTKSWINHLSEYKYLGYWINEHLDQKTVVDKVALTARRSLGSLIAKSDGRPVTTMGLHSWPSGRLVTLLWQKCSQICCWQEESKERARPWSFRSLFWIIPWTSDVLSYSIQLGLHKIATQPIARHGTNVECIFIDAWTSSHTSFAPQSQDGVWLSLCIGRTVICGRYPHFMWNLANG